ncbi:uncharacterized protein LOC113558221 [Rhopalosiphum maidis]|uniref:uncharacterized protein LOC113558221 n=1 Tax=Rhopalosiphum maidis TaxID=43146 RepID=UPI000F000257|nr:uncharacterized protein LOC113558221 [Rhopalosiphum maidis]
MTVFTLDSGVQVNLSVAKMEPELADVVLSVCGVLAQECANQIISNRKKKRKIWVRDWVARRNILSGSNTLLTELRVEDRPGFMNYMRMSDGHFNILLKKLETRIQKQDTFFREVIPAKTKLEITLRFLATGESYSSLQYFFRVPKCTISLFVPDVCTEIYNVLENFIKCPSSVEEWNEIGKNFGLRWNCPDCYGAIDGKHIVIKAPANSGSEFFNYKGSFSIVLLAVVDHDYCFRYLDVGANGRCYDGGIFRNSSLKLAIENDFLNLPENGYFVAFPLTKYMMKPYSRRKLSKEHYIFNYRLSRARRIVENAFGILAHRFQIYLKPIQLQPSKIEEIVKATCALHDWLRITSGSTYMPPGSYD